MRLLGGITLQNYRRQIIQNSNRNAYTYEWYIIFESIFRFIIATETTGPTKPLVQVLQKNKRTTSSTTAKTKNLKVESKLLTNTKNYEMRDLYHRRDKLAYWIQRVNAELEDPDKTDVM